MIGRELVSALALGNGGLSIPLSLKSCNHRVRSGTAGEGALRERPSPVRICPWSTASPEVAKDGLNGVIQRRRSPPPLHYRAVSNGTGGRATSHRAATQAPPFRDTKPLPGLVSV